MVYTNKSGCFANRGIARCTILITKNCQNCSFFKTLEQYKSDRERYRAQEIAFLVRHGITYRKR